MTYFATTLVTGARTAAALTGRQVIRRPPIVSRSGGDVIAVQGALEFPSGTNLAVNDVIELAILPADHIPIDFLLTSDQFDSNATPTLAANFGVMTGAVGDASRNQATVGTEGGAAVKWGSVAGCTARAGSSNGTAHADAGAVRAVARARLGAFHSGPQLRYGDHHGSGYQPGDLATARLRALSAGDFGWCLTRVIHLSPPVIHMRLFRNRLFPLRAM